MHSTVVFAFAAFAIGTEAYVFSGLLAGLAADLDVSVAAAGQLSTVFAAAYAFSAPFFAILVARLDRKVVIVTALSTLVILNAGATLAHSFDALLIIRVLCGLTAAIATPLLLTCATSLVPEAERGRTLAIVLTGMTLAFVIGIPLGSIAGDAFGWRATFVFAAILAAIAALAVQLLLPVLPTDGALRSDGWRNTLTGGRAILYSTTLLSFASAFTVATYIGPVVTRITGFTGSGIAAMQMLVGVGCIAGAVLGGRLADLGAGKTVIRRTLLVLGCAVALYSVWMMPVAPEPGGMRVVLLSPTIVIAAAALYCLIPILQVMLISEAGEMRNMVLAINSSMIYLGQAAGALLGGIVIETLGLAYVGLAGAGLAAISIVILFATITRNVVDTSA
jgi:predicted MFS family arabinose efflux permease